MENICVGFIQFTSEFIFAQQEMEYAIHKKAFFCELLWKLSMPHKVLKVVLKDRKG